MDPQTLITDAFLRGTCRLLTLSQPEDRGSEIQKITWRPVVLRGEVQYQATRQTQRQAFHVNHSADEAAREATAQLAATFLNASLFTEEADYSIRRSVEGRYRVRKSAPTKASREAGAAPTSHNRTRSYLIPEGQPCDFLHAIGVMTAEGQVRQSMSHKFRQINRFLELVNDVVPSLPPDRPLRVVDFGCGKSYLTFALHHLLTRIHQRDATLVGLDHNPQVVSLCQSVADRLKCTGLSFHQGAIAGFRPEGSVDLAVSLHACDTATDDALAQAIAWNCPVILAAPCCQHELSPQIQSRPLTGLMKHGILHERFASLATDALRAAVLDLQGYKTQIVEFIDLEHTPKNLLLRAVRRERTDPEARERTQAEFAALKQSLGIETTFLERLLAETLQASPK